MKNSTKMLLRVMASLVVIAVGSYVIVAQDTITGTWKASTEQAKKSE